MKKEIKILTLTLIFIALAPFVLSFPQLPTEFYGYVIYYNDLGPANRLVTAHDLANNTCGRFITQNPGFFGVISCNSDDNQTSTDEGAVNGETITFFFDSEEATAIGDPTHSPSQYKNLTLIIPKLVCGDLYCQDVYELCGNCEVDCGTCPPTNITPPQTNETEPPPSDGGGGGDAGSGGVGGGVIDLSKITGDIPFNLSRCEEIWNCTSWSECYINETQDRTCNDLNNCETTRNKPPEIQVCIYEGTCDDGIKNGNEQEIDCGGPCQPCPGKEYEPHCFDGRKNCHSGSCEAGVDCGGPCANACEKKERLEIPISICNKPSALFKPQFLMLYGLLIVFILLYVGVEKERERRVKRDKELKDVDKARKYLAIERQVLFFIIFVIILFSSTISYYVFFFCSQNFYKFLNFLIPALLIIPFLAFHLMRVFEYDEDKRKAKLNEFLNTHHEHLKKLVMLQNEYLMDIEVELSNEIYQLSKNPSFKRYMNKFPDLKVVYKDMLTLYDEYKERKSDLKVEKELVQRLKQLRYDEHFKHLSSLHPETKIIFQHLETLYKAYEEKQEIYDQIEMEEKGVEAASKEEVGVVKKEEPEKKEGKKETEETPKDQKNIKEN